jgi:hypothetical protein
MARIRKFSGYNSQIVPLVVILTFVFLPISSPHPTGLATKANLKDVRWLEIVRSFQVVVLSTERNSLVEEKSFTYVPQKIQNEISSTGVHYSIFILLFDGLPLEAYDICCENDHLDLHYILQDNKLLYLLCVACPCRYNKIKFNHDCHSHVSRCEVCHRECSGSGHVTCGKCCSENENILIVAVGDSSKVKFAQDNGQVLKQDIGLHNVVKNIHKETTVWICGTFVFHLGLFCIDYHTLILFSMFVAFFVYLLVKFSLKLFIHVCPVCEWFYIYPLNMSLTDGSCSLTG